MDISEAVMLAREGNNDAFTFLYENTYSRSHYTALKYLGNEDRAEDVLQMAYIRAFKHLDKLKDPSKFAAWIARIVANLSINELKKENPILFSETENEDEQDISDTFKDERIANQPELALDQKETSKIVQEIINELSDEQRVCVTMFYMDEMCVKEMATMLGVSENTVKSRLNYGRQKIKAKVEELEKKGVKIMGVAPVMFFLIAFKTDAKACELAAPTLAGFTATSAKATATAVKAASTKGAETIATQTAEKTVEKTAAKAAASQLKGIAPIVAEHKAVAAIATVAVLGGGATAVEVQHLQTHEEVLENYAESLNDLSGTGFKVLVVDDNGVSRATIDELDAGMIGYSITDDGENLFALEYANGQLELNSYIVGTGNKIVQADSYVVGEPFAVGDYAYTDAFIYTEDQANSQATIVIEKTSSLSEGADYQIYLLQSNEDGSLEDKSYTLYSDASEVNDEFYTVLEESANSGSTMYKQLSNVKKLGALSYDSDEL